MRFPGLEKMRLQLLVAWAGENFAGGLYHQLSRHYADRPELAKRLKRTAGDEVRHGGYFKAAYAEAYGGTLGFRDLLMNAGRSVGRLERLVPEALVPVSVRFNALARGEASAVRFLYKELSAPVSNPYLKVVERILPDEEEHAAPYEF